MSTDSVLVRGWLSPRNVDRMRALLRFAFALFADVQVRGLEHLPSGACLICPNHLSRFDAPLVFSLLKGRKVTALAADTYRPHWFFRRFMETVDVIWVHRGAMTPGTLKAALQILREGQILGVAPEGTRSLTGTLQAGKPGAVALALAAGVPVVPLGITDTARLGQAVRRLQRIRLTLTFGEPLSLPPVERGERAAKLDEYTAEVMCRIAALLPERYHGVYAHHPRLEELLSAGAGRHAENRTPAGRGADGSGLQ
jgi:1-acyl-sn-glycerol-3-phosphate acyltransferase